MSYQKKIEFLKPWFLHIVEAVKKDLKQEHLQKNRQFTKTYFGNKPIQKIASNELACVYGQLVENGSEEMAEFIAVRWVLKHSELYHFFEKILTTIDPDFDKLDLLDRETSETLMKDAVDEYGAINTYIFTIFNSVVFPEDLLLALKEKAEKEKQLSVEKETKAEEVVAIEELKKKYTIDLQRVVDRYEKKLIGLQKKYVQDTENLKKQLSGLQRKLS